MKRVMYCIVVCLSFQLHAMKRRHVETKKNNPCYLAIIPEDIQNLIVEFLTCDDETEEQFMARVKLEKDQRKRILYYSYISPNYEVQMGYCTDERKPITLDHYGAKYKKYLCKIDDSVVADEKKKSFTCHMDKPKYFILSRYEKLCAVVGYKLYDDKPRGLKSYPSRIEYIGKSTRPRHWFKVLHIYNLTTGSKREFGLKDSYNLIQHVDFNKQGTRVIVYSKSSFYYEAYETLSLKNKDKNKQKIENNSNSNTPKKTLLEDYLSKKGVCEKLQMTL